MSKMTRREFNLIPIATSRFEVFFLFLLLFVFLKPAQAQNRIDTLIDKDWKFSISYDGGRKESTAEHVNLPHTWNNHDIQSGKIDYYRGVGVYRKEIFFDESLDGKRVFLRFDAASLVADLFINNKFVGEHRGGYTAFCYEITPYLEYGKENLITVEVNNSWRSGIMPLTGDFNIFGGIYRPVHLIITDAICISPLDFASSGVYLTQSNVSHESAQMEVRTVLSNGHNEAKNFLVKTIIYDENGKEVGHKSSKAQMGANQNESLVQDFVVEKPHLWNGKKYPYLYNVKVQLLSDGRVTDEISQPLGFRYFRVDPQKGFFLNGKYLDLYGVSRHQDRLDRGNALTKEDHEEDISLILELGANAVRLCHYPQSQYFISLCDSSGLIVWSELPFVNLYTKSAAFEKNGIEQLEEMIHQLYNHPSIIFWGLFNELRVNQDDPTNYVEKLEEVAKEIDKYRITTAATDISASFDTITDVIAWNRYFGWYAGKAHYISTWLDSMHAVYPDRCIGLSEYGAGGSIRMHEESFDKPVEPKGKWHPEEWQDHFHEVYWSVLKTRPYVWCKLIWNMFDFASATRREGDTDGRNDKGLVTYDRKTKKDVFYFYKANWSNEPVIHLVNKIFRVRERQHINVKVYSNMDEVGLLVNGKEIGRSKGNDIKVFEWKNVKLKDGNNFVLVRGLMNGQQYTDSCRWWYEP